MKTYKVKKKYIYVICINNIHSIHIYNMYKLKRYVCVCIYIYIYIYTYTHIHIKNMYTKHDQKWANGINSYFIVEKT